MARDSTGKGRRVEEEIEEEEEVPANTQNSAMEVDDDEDEDGAQGGSSTAKTKYDPDQGDLAIRVSATERHAYIDSL